MVKRVTHQFSLSSVDDFPFTPLFNVNCEVPECILVIHAVLVVDRPDSAEHHVVREFKSNFRVLVVAAPVVITGMSIASKQMTHAVATVGGGRRNLVGGRGECKISQESWMEGFCAVEC